MGSWKVIVSTPSSPMSIVADRQSLTAASQYQCNPWVSSASGAVSSEGSGITCSSLSVGVPVLPRMCASHSSLYSAVSVSLRWYRQLPPSRAYRVAQLGQTRLWHSQHGTLGPWHIISHTLCPHRGIISAAVLVPRS